LDKQTRGASAQAQTRHGTFLRSSVGDGGQVLYVLYGGTYKELGAGILALGSLACGIFEDHGSFRSFVACASRRKPGRWGRGSASRTVVFQVPWFLFHTVSARVEYQEYRAGLARAAKLEPTSRVFHPVAIAELHAPFQSVFFIAFPNAILRGPDCFTRFNSHRPRSKETCAQPAACSSPAGLLSSLVRTAAYAFKRDLCWQTSGTRDSLLPRKLTSSNPSPKDGVTCMNLMCPWYVLPSHAIFVSEPEAQKEQIHISKAQSPEEDPNLSSKAIKLMHRFTPEEVLAKMDAVERS